MYLTPADYVIRVFGGVRKTAYAIGKSPTAVCRWRKPRSASGCAGGIPRLTQQDLLRIARARGLDITPDDLLNGREVPSVD